MGNTQTLASSQPKNVVIRASAGAGKTFQLTNRFLWLLARGERLDSILATTFSREAAGEILDRILSRLAEALEDETSLRSLQETIAPHWDRATCHQVLRQTIRHLHHVQIRTLDSFFVRIAQSLSLELKLPPGWTILEDDQDEVLRSLALSRLLQDAEQARAWLHLLFKGEAVRTISKQVQDLIREEYERVFLEATPDAWKRLTPRGTMSDTEVARALERLESYPIENLKSSLQDALERDLERAKGGQWAEFLQRGLAAKIAKGEDTYRWATIPLDLSQLYGELIEHAQAVVLNTVIHQTTATYNLFAEFDTIYQTLKREAGRITFHDVARYLRDYLNGNSPISLETWTYRTGSEVWHLLLDEFQDTSVLQWQVLEGLAQRICRDSKGTFFCVGDVKQSIYAWRGSEPGIFNHLESSLPEIHPQPLDTSWRSSPVIIEVVNRFFQGLAQSSQFGVNREIWHSAIQHWCSRFTPHSTVRSDYPGYCCMVVKETTQGDEVSPEETNESDELLQATEDDESILVKYVRQLYDAPCRPTIGILVRKNEAIKWIVAELRQKGFYVSQEGHNPVTASPAVQLILNVLRLADHPSDSAAALRVLTSPLKEFVTRIAKRTVDNGAPDFQEFSRQLRRRLLNQGYGSVIRTLANDLAPYVSAEEHFWLEKLIEISSLYDNRLTARVRDFLTWLDHQEVSGAEEVRIRVMTIHGAKGLQFDAVLLPDLDAPMGRRQSSLIYARSNPAGTIDWVCRGVSQELLEAGGFPNEVRSAYEQCRSRWIQEDLSVLYVAMTRAIYGLYLFVGPKKEGRSSPNLSFSGLLKMVLAQQPATTPGNIIFESGDPSWFSKIKRPTSDENLPQATSLPRVSLRKPSRLARSFSWTVPHEAEAQPSAMADLLQWEPDDSLRMGTVIHAWLSRVRWLDQDGLPNEDERRTVALELLGSLDRFARLDTFFQEILQRPTIRSLLSLTSYQEMVTGQEQTPAHNRPGLQNPKWELYLEQPFVIRGDGAYTRGQFDRVVVLLDGQHVVGADIIDFKSDNVTSDRLKERIEFYRPQLELYHRAAAEWLHVPESEVSARIAFVHSGIVVRVY